MYMLIHGSWHGAWCWYKVAPLLEGRVVVPNLPGRGARGFVTLGTMVRALERQLGPATTIVVHSRYGVLATALAERCPERVKRVIYLASFMLPSGDRVIDHFRSDRDSFIAPHVEVNRLLAWDRLAEEAYDDGLYADCSAADRQLARALLCREPSLPALARVHTTDRVPKAYIRLDRDRAVSPALQDRLISLGKPARVERIDASHSAYFSQPQKLADTIRSLSRD